MKSRILLAAAIVAAGTHFVSAQDLGTLEALPAKPKVIVKPPAGSILLQANAVPAGNGFLLGWMSTKPGGPPFFLPNNTVMMRAFAANGRPSKAAVTIKEGGGLAGLPRIAELGGNKFAVVYNNLTNIEGGIFDFATNKYKAVPGTLAISHGGTHHELVAIKGSRLALVTMESSFLTQLIRITITDNKLNKLAGPVTIGGEYDSAWTSRDFTVVDSDNGGFAIWRDRPSGDLMMRAFSNAGQPTGKEKKVNSTAMPVVPSSIGADTFGVRAVRLTNGRILVAWTSTEGDNGQDIRARLFTPTGVPMGKDFIVNTDRVETQFFPEPVALESGRFAIGWVSNVFSTLTRTHHIRAYSAAKVPGPVKTTHTIVNPTDGNIDTSIARLEDGSLVEVFHEGEGQPVVADGIAAP